MGFYDKKIYYLDLWEYEEKVNNAGFVKLDVRDDECRIWISTKHMDFEGIVVAKLYLCSEDKLVLADQMILHQGMGTYAAKWNADHLAETDISYADLDGVRIELSEHRYIEKRWNTQKEDKPDEKRIEPERAVPIEEKAEQERTYATKWAMMQQYYKKKIPFGDDREYLCITPEDLILLPEKYEYLLNNSFLLHGYYAYGHLLLGAIAMQSRNIYRLYIPGVGHEKEQIVATLFGFGNFAPVNEKYGYYYMTVEL